MQECVAPHQFIANPSDKKCVNHGGTDFTVKLISRGIRTADCANWNFSGNWRGKDIDDAKKTFTASTGSRFVRAEFFLSGGLCFRVFVLERCVTSRSVADALSNVLSFRSDSYQESRDMWKK
jgi:hypothetical protein